MAYLLQILVVVSSLRIKLGANKQITQLALYTMIGPKQKWILLFFKFPFYGDFSLHLHKMEKKHQETSRKLKIYKGMFFETC